MDQGSWRSIPIGTAVYAELPYSERMLDVHRLRILVEAADRGSLSAAAEALFLTQPAVSRQIAALERDLGTPLVQRLPRGVRLTQAGELAYEHARAILASLKVAEEQVRGLARLDEGRLRMAAFATVNAFLMPMVMARYRRRHPRVDLSLVSDHGSRQTLEAVRSGDIDLGVITDWDLDRSGDVAGVEVEALFDDQLFVALAPCHKLAAEGLVPLAELADETWIEGAHPDCCGPIEGFRETTGYHPKIGFHCDDWYGKQALVAAGVGIMPFPALALPGARDDIVLRPTTPTLKARRILAVTRAAIYRPATVQPMLDLLHETLLDYANPAPHLTSAGAAAHPERATAVRRTPKPSVGSTSRPRAQVKSDSAFENRQP
jgi:DNA-binding transcriptional LysR family regulator